MTGRIDRLPVRFTLVWFTLALAAIACGAASEGEPPQAPAFTASASPTPLGGSQNVTQDPPIPAAPTPVPAIPENRRLTLTWPGAMRVGDADVVQLILEVDEAGNLTPTAEFAGHEVRSEVVAIPNLYETHHVLAEARLDLTGLQIAPAGTISQPLLPGERVQFLWSVSPDRVGNFRGTVWLFLRFIPHDGGAESQRPVSAQVIEIQAVNLLGIGGAPARVLGVVGTAIGSLLGLDDLLSWLRRFRGRLNRAVRQD